MPGSRGSETLADKNEEATRWVFNCLHPRQRQFNSARLSAQAATDACQGSKNMVTSHINPPSAVQLYSDDERRLFSSQISARQIWRRLKSHSLTKKWSKKWRFVKIEAVGKRRRDSDVGALISALHLLCSPETGKALKSILFIWQI